jgi:acyl carrier protein
MTVSTEDVRVLLRSCLERSMSPLGLVPDQLADDLDLRAQGLVDSLGFVELMVKLEEQLGFAIDLVDLDPALLTTVGPLCRHIAATNTRAEFRDE